MMSYTPPNTSGTNYLTCTPSSDATGALDVSVWLKGNTATHYVMYCNGLSLLCDGNTYEFQVANGNGFRSFKAAANSVTAAWTHYLLHKKTDGGCLVYQDGTLLSTDSTARLDTTSGVTGTVTMLRGGGEISDLRVISGTTDSTAWEYYRSDVLAGGNKCLPNG